MLTLTELLTCRDKELVAKELVRYGTITFDVQSEDSQGRPNRLTIFHYEGRKWRVRKQCGVVLWIHHCVLFGED